MSTGPLSLLFYGTPKIAETCLNALLNDQRYNVRAVVTQPDRPLGRKQVVTASPVKVLAESHHIPVIQPENIKKATKEFITQVAEFGPFDFAVVVAFGQILPIEVLNIPRIVSINLHASLLPRWRGAAPIQRAIMANDKETGVCLMQMDAGLDTGAVYARTKIVISNDDNAATIHDALADSGAQLLCSDLIKIASGELTAIPQASEGVSYAKKISDSDCLIDWSASAQTICAQIRGLAPIPGAFTYLQGKRLKIFLAEPSYTTPTPSAPGTILESHTTMRIACGEQTILIKEVQIEGKKRVSISEFLKGNQLPAGLTVGT
jgi:methionyl-tRNA formyltransferase